MKTALISLAAALAVLVPTSVAAQDADAPAAAQFEPGAFRIMPLWSTDPEGFLAVWGQPTPPTLSTTLSTVRNQPIQQFILYANCTRNDEGHCHLRARVSITGPDGSPYGEEMVFDALPQGVPVVEENHFGLAPNSIGIRVDDDEQVGFYTVDLEITDVFAGTKAYNTVQIEVTEAP